jgi:hypothetical protein
MRSPVICRIGQLREPADPAAPQLTLAPSVGKPSAPAEQRFGYSEAQRKDILKRIVSAEDEAYAQAQRRYPSDP